mgnify:CR=1 FL=1
MEPALNRCPVAYPSPITRSTVMPLAVASCWMRGPALSSLRDEGKADPGGAEHPARLRSACLRSVLLHARADECAEELAALTPYQAEADVDDPLDRTRPVLRTEHHEVCGALSNERTVVGASTATNLLRCMPLPACPADT